MIELSYVCLKDIIEYMYKCIHYKDMFLMRSKINSTCDS